MKHLLNLLILLTILLFGCDKDDDGISFEDMVALDATNITSYGFQANWQIVENSESYELEISTDNVFSIIVKTAQVSGSSNNFIIVSSLNQNLEYFYRVKYSIGGKSSSYSNTISVSTFNDITALDASNITQTGFQANWSIIENAEKYDVEISTDTEFADIVKNIQITGAQNDSLVVNDLEKDVEYHYRVRYYEGTEESHYSNTISVTTNYVEFSTITALEASNITTTGFQANWNVIEDAEKYELEISTNNDFTDIVKTSQVSGAENDSLIVEGLDKNVTYYYRVRYYVWDKSSDNSNTINVRTNYVNSDISISTNGITTKATITYKLDYAEPVPAIIFLHMGTASRSEWTNNQLYAMCVDSGYVALAYDLRGHGETEGTIDWSTFTTDPNLLPKDLDDVILYLQGKDFVDPDRIGMVGGSMGAILATGATQYPEVKVTIALTSFYDAVESLYGISNINTVFYIAGEHDNADESQALYDITNDPRKIEIVEGSSSHSAALINTDERRKEVFDWIKEYI